MYALFFSFAHTFLYVQCINTFKIEPKDMKLILLSWRDRVTKNVYFKEKKNSKLNIERKKKKQPRKVKIKLIKSSLKSTPCNKHTVSIEKFFFPKNCLQTNQIHCIVEKDHRAWLNIYIENWKLIHQTIRAHTRSMYHESGAWLIVITIFSLFENLIESFCSCCFIWFCLCVCAPFRFLLHTLARPFFFSCL